MTSEHDYLVRFINEVLTDDEARDIVGNYLWPTNRKKKIDQSSPRWEIDTEQEANLRNVIIGYVMNHSENPMSDSDAELLYNLSQTNLYRDILPKTKMRNTSLYRGISVSAAWFERNYGISYEEFLDNLPAEQADMKVSKSMTHAWSTYKIESHKRSYFPKNKNAGVSSWTRKFDTALKFASGMEVSGSPVYLVPLVFETKGNDSSNKLIDLGGVYKLARIVDRSGEREVLSIGPVRIHNTYVGVWNFRTKDRIKAYVYKNHGTSYDDINAKFDEKGYADFPRENDSTDKR
jgi:hypothetical protein